MKRLFLAAAALLGTLALPSAPAAAQGDWAVRDVFGDDACPTSNGEEIVVCRRLPDSERYRIPKDLRDAAKGDGPPGWRERVQALEYVGASGTNSCSPDGAGGWTGCWSRIMREARADRKARQEAEKKVQDALP